MTAATSFRLRPLLGATLLATLAATACGGSLAQVPATDLDGQARRLATDDAQLQRARWGDLALAAGKTWLFVAPGEIANVWRDVHWEVPGSVLKYHRGFCLALKCEGTQYVVRFNEQ